MPSNQREITKQAKFTNSLLGKAFEKQIKTIEEQGKKQVEALEVLDPEKNKKQKSVEGLFSKEMKNVEIKNEIDDIKKFEKKIKRKDLKFETNRYIFDFQQFETIRSFGDSIYNGKVNIKEAEIKQTNLLENIINFSNKSRSKTNKQKDKKQITFDSINALYEGRELVLNAFRSGIFPIKKHKEKD